MEQRLIDANRLQLEVDKFFRDECRVLYDLTSLISVMPTVDAVPVVRCGECKHYEPCEGGKDYCCWHGSGVVENDFCSYGERRDSDG